MKTIGRLGCAALSLLFVGSAAAQIVWDFSSGTGAPSNLPDYLSGGVLGAGNLDGTLLFNSTSACGIAGSSKGNNAGLRTLETSTFNSEASSYFEFTLTPDAGYRVEVRALSFNTRRSSSGPTDVRFYSSLDNYSFSQGTTLLAVDKWTSITLGELSLSGDIGTPITFRIYGGPPTGSASTPNWRIDDLAVTVAAVPEPATVAVLFGGMALAAAIVGRFRSRRIPTDRESPISSRRAA